MLVSQFKCATAYRHSGMALVTFTGRSVKLKDGMLRFPRWLPGKSVVWFRFFFPANALKSRL